MSISNAQVQLLTYKLLAKLALLAKSSVHLSEDDWVVESATHRKILITQRVTLWANSDDTVKLTFTLSTLKSHIKAQIRCEAFIASPPLTPSRSLATPLQSQLKLKKKNFEFINKAVDKLLISPFWFRAEDVVECGFTKFIQESALERASAIALKTEEANTRYRLRLEAAVAKPVDAALAVKAPLDDANHSINTKSEHHSDQRSACRGSFKSSPELRDIYMPSKDSVITAFKFQQLILEMLMTSTQSTISWWRKPF